MKSFGLFQEMLGTNDNEFLRNVDIVFVIDASENMYPIIEKLKRIESWKHIFEQYWRYSVKSINQLRVKATWFRDFHFSGGNVYGESRFFDLFKEDEEFIDYLNGIDVSGGGVEASSGLEALYMAMKSDFVQEGTVQRHIIVLITDKSAYPLYEHSLNLFNTYSDIPDYIDWSPNGFALGSLNDDKLSVRGRRLIICAPCIFPWSDMEVDYDYTIRLDISQGDGGADLEIDELFKCIECAIR